MDNRQSGNPRTPVRSVLGENVVNGTGNGNAPKYPLSSPYAGKSPLPMPILPNSQYHDNAMVKKRTDTLTNRLQGYAEYENKDGFGGEYGDLPNSGKIELFDKSIMRHPPPIPAVGCNVTETPIFNNEIRADFIDGLDKIGNRCRALSTANDAVAELNESLGAYLFGLFQNAWCVNLNENVNMETIDKVNTVKKLTREVEELKMKVEVAKRNSVVKEQQKRRQSRIKSIDNSKALPLSRLSVRPSHSKFGNVTGLKRSRSPTMSDQPEPKRNFLRAGSRSKQFLAPRPPARDNRRQGQSRRQGQGLHLSYAKSTKLQNFDLADDSLSDVSNNTSEVQTLTTIQRLQSQARAQSQSQSLSNSQTVQRRGGQVHRVNAGQTRETWQVQHRQPFR
jgi:hypothetical protein